VLRLDAVHARQWHSLFGWDNRDFRDERDSDGRDFRDNRESVACRGQGWDKSVRDNRGEGDSTRR
jgi:hypothetical protein